MYSVGCSSSSLTDCDPISMGKLLGNAFSKPSFVDERAISAQVFNVPLPLPL